MAKSSKIDVQKHSLVPKHSKLSEKEKNTLLEQYRITNKELPKINIKDAAIAHLDVKIGDIIKIERKSTTASKATYYRGVVSD